MCFFAVRSPGLFFRVKLRKKTPQKDDAVINWNVIFHQIEQPHIKPVQVFFVPKITFQERNSGSEIEIRILIVR